MLPHPPPFPPRKQESGEAKRAGSTVAKPVTRAPPGRTTIGTPAGRHNVPKATAMPTSSVAAASSGSTVPGEQARVSEGNVLMINTIEQFEGISANGGVHLMDQFALAPALIHELAL